MAKLKKKVAMMWVYTFLEYGVEQLYKSKLARLRIR